VSDFATQWCPKMLREYLCTQQTFAPDSLARDSIAELIAVLDRHRPLGSNGKHGSLHTEHCGCDGERDVHLRGGDRR